VKPLIPNKKKILVVDDDKELGASLVDMLSFKGYNVRWVGNGPDALNTITTDSIDIVLLDLLLPGMDGLEVLKHILQISPLTIVIMMSGHGTIQTALEATQLGAYDWLEKPLTKDRLLLTVRNAIDKNTLMHDREILLSEAKSRYRMVGISPALKNVYKIIDKVADKNTTILISGESGTGKELVARAIYINSQRVTAPFIKVNCAAIPETLIESELFGHVKGAFTGALNDKEGKFQLAHNGTLFLDEIGDLSLSAQSKVLRTIETGELSKVGTEKIEVVDIRLITATNKDLSKMISEGTFREDLYHRINVIEINIPPLRERPDDILPLVHYFLEQFCIENALEKKEFTSSAEALLLSHSWPGNVRELRNFTEKVTVLVELQKVTVQQIADLLKFPKLKDDLIKPRTFKLAKENFEDKFIRDSLIINDWNITRTAIMLDIPRSLLYQKIKKYSIEGVSTNRVG